MSRLLVAVIALSVLGYLAYRTLYGRAAAVSDEAPTQRLEHVKSKVKDVEVKEQERADELEKKLQE